MQNPYLVQAKQFFSSLPRGFMYDRMFRNKDFTKSEVEAYINFGTEHNMTGTPFMGTFGEAKAILDEARDNALQSFNQLITSHANRFVSHPKPMSYVIQMLAMSALNQVYYKFTYDEIEFHFVEALKMLRPQDSSIMSLQELTRSTQVPTVSMLSRPLSAPRSIGLLSLRPSLQALPSLRHPSLRRPPVKGRPPLHKSRRHSKTCAGIALTHSRRCSKTLEGGKRRRFRR